jgi:hypothetical protein
MRKDLKDLRKLPRSAFVSYQKKHPPKIPLHDFAVEFVDDRTIRTMRILSSGTTALRR